MRLPDDIDRAIEREATAVPGKALARAAEALSLRYRERPGSTHALTDVERLAYLVVRASATYGAVATVLDELRARVPALRVTSLLDLGAGPGAATWAALAQRDDLARITLIERDRGFIELGTRILGDRDLDVEWRCANLNATQPQAHDLVILSYALGEVRERDRAALVARAWEAAGQALIVIEPGTTHHFAGVLAARDQLIHAGAFIAAPCPHAVACPMAGNDWCHRPARIERSSLQRRVKGGTLSYEDEKFSYLIAVRAPTEQAPAERAPAERVSARIVRHPEIQKGFIMLTLCTAEGLRREGVPRSQRDAFKRARKAAWGDAF